MHQRANMCAVFYILTTILLAVGEAAEEEFEPIPDYICHGHETIEDNEDNCGVLREIDCDNPEKNIKKYYFKGCVSNDSECTRFGETYTDKTCSNNPCQRQCQRPESCGNKKYCLSFKFFPA